MEVTDSEFSRQYQAKQNGELAFVEYSIQERKIFFTKTLLPESADEAFVDEFFKEFWLLYCRKSIRWYRYVRQLLLSLNATKSIKRYYQLASEFDNI